MVGDSAPFRPSFFALALPERPTAACALRAAGAQLLFGVLAHAIPAAARGHGLALHLAERWPSDKGSEPSPKHAERTVDVWVDVGFKTWYVGVYKKKGATCEHMFYNCARIIMCSGAVVPSCAGFFWKNPAPNRLRPADCS